MHVYVPMCHALKFYAVFKTDPCGFVACLQIKTVTLLATAHSR